MALQRQWSGIIGNARGKRLHCCHPPPSDQFCNQGIFRISDMWVWTNPCGPVLFPPTLSLIPSTLLFPLSHSPPLPLPLLFPTYLPISYLFPFPPLEVGPLNPAKSSGFGAEPKPKLNLVHFSLKIWHLVPTNLDIFLWIKWPNFMQNLQVLCRIWKHVNSADRHWMQLPVKQLRTL